MPSKIISKIVAYFILLGFTFIFFSYSEPLPFGSCLTLSLQDVGLKKKKSLSTCCRILFLNKVLHMKESSYLNILS